MMKGTELPRGIRRDEMEWTYKRLDKVELRVQTASVNEIVKIDWAVDCLAIVRPFGGVKTFGESLEAAKASWNNLSVIAKAHRQSSSGNVLKKWLPVLALPSEECVRWPATQVNSYCSIALPEAEKTFEFGRVTARDLLEHRKLNKGPGSTMAKDVH